MRSPEEYISLVQIICGKHFHKKEIYNKINFKSEEDLLLTGEEKSCSDIIYNGPVDFSVFDKDNQPSRMNIRGLRDNHVFNKTCAIKNMKLDVYGRSDSFRVVPIEVLQSQKIEMSVRLNYSFVGQDGDECAIIYLTEKPMRTVISNIKLYTDFIGDHDKDDIDLYDDEKFAIVIKCKDTAEVMEALKPAIACGFEITESDIEELINDQTNDNKPNDKYS